MFLCKALHAIDSRIKKGKKQQSFSSFLFLHFVPICGLCCTLLALFKVQFVNLSKSMALLIYLNLKVSDTQDLYTVFYSYNTFFLGELCGNSYSCSGPYARQM